MKPVSTLALLSVALATISGVMTAPVDNDNTSPALTTPALDKRQLLGVICVPAKAEGLTVTSAELDAEEPGSELEPAAATTTPANATANVLEAQANAYAGQCLTGNQICYLAWRYGNARCTGYCHCPTTNYCTGTNNYCYWKTNNGPCVCT